MQPKCVCLRDRLLLRNKAFIRASLKCGASSAFASDAGGVPDVLALFTGSPVEICRGHIRYAGVWEHQHMGVRKHSYEVVLERPYMPLTKRIPFY